jgi:hypothetical protein
MNARNLGCVVLALVCQCLSQPAAALAIADSSIALFDLSITPATGTVEFDGGVPTAQAFAQAANSLGELKNQFGSSPPDPAHAEASVTWAEGTGDASAASFTASAASAVNLPGHDNFAASLGQGSLFGSFTITGGTGSVNVVFSMALAGHLHGFADEFGRFETEVITALDVDGSSVLFDRFELHGGPNFPDLTIPLSEILTATLALEFDVPYFLFAQADSETFARNIPEPGTLVLTLLGLTGAAQARRKFGHAAQIRRLV